MNLALYERRTLLSLILCYESEVHKKGIVKLLSFLFTEMKYCFLFLVADNTHVRTG